MLGKAMRIVTVCTLAFAICADRARKTPKTVPSKAWTSRRLLAKSLLLGASVQAASGFVHPPHPARGLGRPAGVRPHEPLPFGVRPHEPLKGWGLDSIKEALAAAERLEGEELEEALAALVEEEVESWDDIRELEKELEEALAALVEKEPKSPNAATNDPATLETTLIDADIPGDADTAGELLTKIQKQKEQTNLGGDSELPKLRTANGKKAPTSLNAVLNDPVTLETMLLDADIAGDADLRDELLAKIQELKEIEDEYLELRTADGKKAPISLNAAMHDLVTLETMLKNADMAGDAVLRDELLSKIKEQKFLEAEYPELRTADGKKAPNSLNAAMDDLVTLETMLITDDIAGDAVLRDELLAKIQEQKDFEAEYPELRTADGKKAPNSLNAAMDDLVTLETMLIDDFEVGYPQLRTADGKKAPKSLTAPMGHLVTLETMLRNADIAGDADLRDELLTKIKAQKEQTNLDGESE